MSSDFTVLGISKNSTSDELRVAYKKKCLEAHPDKGGSATDFHRIQVAYQNVKNLVKANDAQRKKEKKAQKRAHESCVDTTSSEKRVRSSKKTPMSRPVRVPRKTRFGTLPPSSMYIPVGISSDNSVNEALGQILTTVRGEMKTIEARPEPPKRNDAAMGPIHVKETKIQNQSMHPFETVLEAPRDTIKTLLQRHKSRNLPASPVLPTRFTPVAPRCISEDMRRWEEPIAVEDLKNGTSAETAASENARAGSVEKKSVTDGSDFMTTWNGTMESVKRCTTAGVLVDYPYHATATGIPLGYATATGLQGSTPRSPSRASRRMVDHKRCEEEEDTTGTDTTTSTTAASSSSMMEASDASSSAPPSQHSDDVMDASSRAPEEECHAAELRGVNNLAGGETSPVIEPMTAVCHRSRSDGKRTRGRPRKALSEKQVKMQTEKRARGRPRKSVVVGERSCQDKEKRKPGRPKK